VEGGNQLLYLPLDKLMEQNLSVLGGNRPGTAQEWRDLADQIAPYLSGPSGLNSVDRSRLTQSGRGGR